jgi:hypothetical protein
MTARKAAVRLIAAIVLMEQRMAGAGRVQPIAARGDFGRICLSHEPALGRLQSIDKDLRPSANGPAGDAPYNSANRLPF